MSDREARSLRPGKIPVALLGDLLAQLPPPPPEVRVGPRIGEDACAIEVEEGVLVAATDPITFTTAGAGSLSVLVNANDVAVTGARPRWFLAVILVPPGTGEAVVREVFADIRRALAGIGGCLVGGHIEVTAAVTQPIVVGQMLGLAQKGRALESGGARPGDVVVQVGPAPIEGASILASALSDRLGRPEQPLTAAARAALDQPGISVVEPALLATRLGASALHDATEGGLAAALHELAHASGVRIRVDREAMLWFEPGLAVCQALGADPWATLASGALLATFPPQAAEAALAGLAESDQRAAVIGAVEPGAGVVDRDGDPLRWPDRDEVARLLSEPGSSS